MEMEQSQVDKHLKPPPQASFSCHSCLPSSCQQCSLEKGKIWVAVGAAAAPLPASSSLPPPYSTPASSWGTENSVVQQDPHGSGARPEMPFSPQQTMPRSQNLCKQSKQKMLPKNHSVWQKLTGE